ncbi:hypothetical protein ACWGF3_11475 [Streptomyces xanthophaeus]
MRTDLAAAVAAAGFPEGTKTGAPTPDTSADRPTTDKERAREQLMARTAACGPTWSSSDPVTSREEDLAEGHRQFDAVLAGLVERGWKETRPAAQMPLGDIGSMVTAEHKKQGWTLYAHSPESGLLRMATITATEDACTSQFTDEELDLLEDRPGRAFRILPPYAARLRTSPRLAGLPSVSGTSGVPPPWECTAPDPASESAP